MFGTSPWITTMTKNGIWYHRGFDSADIDRFISGSESPQERAESVGNKYGYSINRYPQKLTEFKRGYFDSLEIQRNKRFASNA